MLPQDVLADDNDAQTSAAARTLLEEADAAFDRGDYTTALDRFTRAYGLVKAPTIAVRQAECLEKLGRIIEASEIYVHTSRMRLDPDAPPYFKRAVATALSRVDALRERFAMLDLTIEGEAIDGVQVFVNGRMIPAVLVGTSFPVNPGKSVIEVVKNKRKASETVMVQERQSARVTITLPPPDPNDEPEGATTPGQAAGGTAPPARPVELERSSQPTWGWVVMGIGVAGVATGAATGLVAMSKRNSLDEAQNEIGGTKVKACDENRVCWNRDQTIDNYNMLRTVSTIGFAVGIVGVGAGLTLLLTAPEPHAREAAGIRPWVGVGSAGLEGRF